MPICETQVTRIEAALDAGVPLAVTLTVRQAVLDAIKVQEARHKEAEEDALCRGENDEAWNHTLLGSECARFHLQARAGANWRKFLYLLDQDVADSLPLPVTR